ncbi:helix-turn-helix domain-containing protein [Nocardiopsis algeriensis]|uniref:Transcriptional regulator with XRE-family HTH domain n=1 Tax=Nocardiopsis algeriensis TaxID=1478215 RepID=A0A841IIJ4_9ACTN|nr:helix-turn-helix transcriptional regulator [Nocardiopsis algeriensis]MBB6118483.1 transcriptional regulator with XRE-family HTH domain [Nocardiopsis algeriensis]
MGGTDPARERFGVLLKKYRVQAGATQQELARSAMVAQSTISDLERGRKGTRRDQVVRIDSALNAHGVLVNAWEAAFSPTGMTGYFREVAEAEQSAVAIRQYALGLVPGLVQSEAYARSVICLAWPHATPDMIDRIVRTRMHRQEILERDHPPVLTVILDETALLRRFKSPEVMEGQVDHLIRLSHRDRVTIQILPMDTEGHPGLGGSFKLIAAPDGGDIVYVEGHEVGISLKEPETVNGYDRIFAELRSAALPVSVSRSRLEQIRGGI